MTVGYGDYRFEYDESWGRMPNGDRTRYVSMLAIDSEERIYAFCRAGEAVRVYSPEGKLLVAWGEGDFLRPHGIAVSPDGLIYVADDKAHVIRSFTIDGKNVRTFGVDGEPRITSKVGCNRPGAKGPLFFAPTHVAFAADGTMFVTDGYGNSEVHRFSRDGDWELTWGEPGKGPGQFTTVHAVCIDADGNVVIADRSNDRLQVFSSDGELLSIIEDVLHPNQVFCDRKNFMYSAGKGRVDIRNAKRELVCRWGKEFVDPSMSKAEILYKAHGLTVDSSGNMYLGDEADQHGGFLRKYRLLA